jgi:Ricin-type beta-trefoil lectin domain-like
MSSIQPNVDYMIVNYNSGLAWAVKGENTDPGTSVVQYSWVIDPGQYNQRWYFESVSGGWRIRTIPAFSQTPLYAALDKERDPNDNNAGVNVYPLQGLSREVWSLSSDQVGEWIVITNVSSGKCLVVRGESTDDQQYIVQYHCEAQAGQRWVILPYISGMTP